MVQMKVQMSGVAGSRWWELLPMCTTKHTMCRLQLAALKACNGSGHRAEDGVKWLG